MLKQRENTKQLHHQAYGSTRARLVNPAIIKWESHLYPAVNNHINRNTLEKDKKSRPRRATVNFKPTINSSTNLLFLSKHPEFLSFQRIHKT